MPATHEIMIRKLSEHSDLDSKDMAALQTLTGQGRKLSPGEDFIRQGDKPHVSVVVEEGMVARYQTLSSGKRQYLSFHMAGDMPDAQTLFIERMDHSVCALGRASIVMIPHIEICALFELRPSVGFAIWRETLIDAAIFRDAITNNGSRTVEMRMAHLFCEIYYRARATGLARPGFCPFPVNQTQLGEALGMSMVTVNRTIQQIRKSGAAELRAGILTVHDWKTLVEIGDFDSNYLNLKRPSRL